MKSGIEKIKNIKLMRIYVLIYVNNYKQITILNNDRK